MSEPRISLQVSLAWWWPAYQGTLLFCCVMSGSAPDWIKLQRRMVSAFRFRVVIIAADAGNAVEIKL